MSRWIQCDVCETPQEIDNEPTFIEVKLPGNLLGEQDNERLPLDVCSVECLVDMGVKLSGGVEEPKEPDEQPAAKPPKASSGSFLPMTPAPDDPDLPPPMVLGEVTVR